jgi:eukaryotic-like serine/threonine-protein kinase
MIGKTLGHYHITSELGKGGMGEVYQAKDQKLGRDVAIKILPGEFAKDTDRVTRFRREAKLLASLNHPNIAAIYGLEDSGETNFLVLELVEGDTLADRIKRGPIPVEETLKVALQIAEALEAAHEKGIIHRDLKPANIKVTPDGKVKVLDFGLAKAFAREPEELNLSNSPTLSNAATQEGIILGTAAYMSPEQARGRAVDKRTDIWAFGCVLFEMITGQAAFFGKGVTDILAAVIRSEPEWNSLPANLNWRLREVLERCLKKELRDRFHDISDVREDIQRAFADSSGVLVPRATTVQPRTSLRKILIWIAVTAILAVTIAGVAVWNLKPLEPHQVTRFVYELPKDTDYECTVAVSSDGRQFAYNTPSGLYLRQMEDMDAKLLPGTAGTLQRPFFSPDGKWIGFFSSTDGKLKKIATSGGAPLTLADISPYASFHWTDDMIVYGQEGKGIMRVSANGGTPELIVKPVENESVLRCPQILPGAEWVLYASALSGEQKIAVRSLKSGERKELFEGYAARYLPTGHIVYESGNSLFAVRFDINSLKVIGGPVPVVEGVLRFGTGAAYAISDSGTLIYIPGTMGAAPQRTLIWLDRKGKEIPIVVAPDNYRQPRISPDGTKVALGIASSNKKGIWILNLLRETMTPLIERGGFYVWSLDGKRVAFNADGNSVLFWRAADGTGGEEKLGAAPRIYLWPWSWSSDGKILVTMDWDGTKNNIGSLSMKGDHKWQPLLPGKYGAGKPRVSPDGRWMAYVSNESGKGEVFVCPFPDVNKGKWPVSTSGGDEPLWSPDGRQLFYRKGDSVMAVVIEPGPDFQVGKPELLFQGIYLSSSTQELGTWDISPNGKRFLMMKEVGSSASDNGGPRKINIVLNWIEELKQRVR